ncbi:hypothetical protein THAOC_21633, partial [Thalassiosira oceanica]
ADDDDDEKPNYYHPREEYLPLITTLERSTFL